VRVRLPVASHIPLQTPLDTGRRSPDDVPARDIRTQAVLHMQIELPFLARVRILSETLLLPPVSAAKSAFLSGCATEPVFSCFLRDVQAQKT
jgi:hypothetical protein